MDRRQFLLNTGAMLGVGTLVTTSAWALPTSPKIKWHNNLRAAYKVARTNDKPLLIVFSASWCTYCHKLLRESLGEKKMVAFVEDQFVPLLLDFDKDAEIAKVLEVESLPCTIVLSPQADLLLQVNGFQKLTAYRQTLQTALDKREELIQQARAESR